MNERYKIVKFENGKYGCFDTKVKEFLHFGDPKYNYRWIESSMVMTRCQSHFLWRAKRLIKKTIKWDIKKDAHSYKIIGESND